MEDLSHGSDQNKKPSNDPLSKQPRVVAKKRIVFGDFEFSPATKKLNYQSAPCLLEPKMLDLLAILIEARPHLVSKDVLMDKLWPDSEVSDWSLARLVSDTRKLIEDNGSAQSIIKTVRGKGFMFVAQADEVFDAYSHHVDTQPPSQPSIERRATPKDNKFVGAKLVWASSLIFLVVTLVFIFLQPLNRKTDSTTQAAKTDHHSAEHYLQVMREIQKNLRLTFTTFQAQARRTKDLGTTLYQRFPESEPLSWEAKFHKHYQDFTKEEMFLFEQIRALTDGSMYQGNKAIFDLLEKHPEIYAEVEAFPALYNHLNIWLNKYQRIFKQREDMPVVYIGVEDGVPFPSEVDSQVDQWIIQATASTSQSLPAVKSNSK